MRHVDREVNFVARYGWLKRAGLAALLVSVSVMPLGARAEAADLIDIKICNNYPDGIYVAIAYPQNESSWISRGWLFVPTDTCSFFDTALHVPTFYLRAETRWHSTGRRRRSREVWGEKGDRSFAVVEDSSGSFNYYTAETKVRGIPNEPFVRFFSGSQLTLDSDTRATVTFNADSTITSSIAPLTPPTPTTSPAPPPVAPPQTSPPAGPPSSSGTGGKNNSVD
jgi:hypothetical protein